MKKHILIPATAMLLFIFSGFTNPSGIVNPDKESIHATYAKDFISTICNESLNARFELQFSGMIHTVNQVDAHYNSELGYYYKVTGLSPQGNKTIEYFKTTEEEVKSGTYNYIRLHEESMNVNATQVCRILPRYGCVKASTGPVCGIVVNGTCLIF